MFGINRKELIQNLEIIRQNLCCYATPEICDCKYFPEGKGKFNEIMLTEHTGCPEIRQVIALLNNMKDEEFHKLAMKSSIMIQY